jgi:hypothetical protein
MEGIKAFFKGEPVAVAALVSAAFTAAIAFGFDVSAEQIAAINGVIVAVSALFARSQVSPT